MRFFGRQFGAARLLAQARAAELRGELGQAVALFAEAGRPDEASRVMLLRGDGEIDSASRLSHFVQAVATAPAGSAALAMARRKRANLVLAIAASESMTPALRQDLIAAARDFEALGDEAEAAEAYGRAGDVDAQAKALARAGDVDKLDALLLAQQDRDREAIARRETDEEVGALIASGRRRDAVAMARASSDGAVRERGRGVEMRRVGKEIVAISLRGQAMSLVLGEEVVVGRVAAISVASAAVSRQHVAIARRGADVVVRDLGGRNGTIVRGVALAGEAVVGSGIEVYLGKEVLMVVRPTSELDGAVAVEIAGAKYVAPLGPAVLGIGAWRLERGPDGWVELASGDDPLAFAGVLRLAPRVTLLRGDGIAAARGAAPVLRLEE